jgi:hypothetical protein
VQRHIDGRSVRDISVALCEELVLGAVYTATLSTCLGGRERERQIKGMIEERTLHPHPQQDVYSNEKVQ